MCCGSWPMRSKNREHRKHLLSGSFVTIYCIIHLTRGDTRQYTKGQDKSKSEPYKNIENFSRKCTFEKKAKKKERKNVYLSFLSFSRLDIMNVTTACTYSLHSGIFCHVIRNTSLLYIVVGR
jgi:hypothetical protein